MKFIAVILFLCVLSLPFVVPFAFDQPGVTGKEVFFALTRFYGGYVIFPWFVVGFVWNWWRG
ncbi:MAG TPA: hypothetical protein PKC14_03185 [Candidatus Absconditabacterales bacterium]|nr:hypothetical protein [Candidatus Absconditabacterales bacterium]